MPRKTLQTHSQQEMDADRRADPPKVQNAVRRLTEVLGPPTSWTKYMWAWEDRPGGLVVNINRQTEGWINVWVSCSVLPERPLRSATFAERPDGVRSRKSSNLSDRLQDGPHLFFRVMDDADFDELLEVVRTQLNGSVSDQHPVTAALQPADGGDVMGTSDAAAGPAEAESAKDGVPPEPVMLTPRFEQAMAYAAVVHAGQTRKGTGITYLSHLLMVAAIAMEYGATEDEAIGALLHDAVEDGGGKARQADINARFAGAVAEIVAGCTDADVLPKPDWTTRKRNYIAHAREATDSVRLVSAADKIANARSILKDYRVLGEALWSRFNKGRAESLWYYRELVEAFGTSRDPRVLALRDELRRTVGEIELLAASPSRP